MARRPRAARLETRTARLKLKVRKKPYDFTSIAPRIRLGYRRCKSAGRWVVKVADGHGGNWTKVVGIADDHEDADGEHIFSWWQAQDQARALARGKDSAGGRPGTVAEALADYEADLIARGASPTNARRVRTLLPPTLLAKPVALLTARELKHVRDGLIAKGAKPASVNRDLKGFKAALNLAAAHDPSITNVVGMADRARRSAGRPSRAQRDPRRRQRSTPADRGGLCRGFRRSASWSRRPPSPARGCRNSLDLRSLICKPTVPTRA